MEAAYVLLQTLPAVEFGPDKDLRNCNQSSATIHCCHGYTGPKANGILMRTTKQTTKL